MLTDRVVICMKWGTLYSADYVNVLFNACKANITGDFRFVCLTDNSHGLEAAIETFPIPEIGLAPMHWKSGAWPKISVFSEHLFGLQGRGLFIDLDMVVWGNLDAFFEYSSDIVTLNSSPWRYKNAPPRTMTSIFAFDIGKMGRIVENLKARRDTLINKYKIEQDYLHGELDGINYWPQEWIKSYKYHLRQPLLIDRFTGPAQPDQSVKIICFHGKPRPIDLICSPKGNWDRFPHYGKGPVPWMVEYWVTNGGSLQQ
jgi:hypothetical protein